MLDNECIGNQGCVIDSSSWLYLREFNTQPRHIFPIRPHYVLDAHPKGIKIAKKEYEHTCFTSHWRKLNNHIVSDWTLHLNVVPLGHQIEGANRDQSDNEKGGDHARVEEHTRDLSDALQVGPHCLGDGLVHRVNILLK